MTSEAFVEMILTDVIDKWVTDERGHLSEESIALLYPDRDNDPIAVITDGGASPRTILEKPATQRALLRALGGCGRGAPAAPGSRAARTQRLPGVPALDQLINQLEEP